MGLFRFVEKVILNATSIIGSADTVDRINKEIRREEASERYSTPTPEVSSSSCHACGGTGRIPCAAYKHGPSCSCGGSGWESCYH